MKYKDAKRPKKKGTSKASLMKAIGNPILANNKEMKISSRTPDSNYA
tara:strand:- start:1032 stop:1172 length:141 start_codon:yes stop_codon:yes gene_type:complete